MKHCKQAWETDDVSILHPCIPTADRHFFAGPVDALCLNPSDRIYSNDPVPPSCTNGTGIGSFADPDNNRRVYDFYRAWPEGTADSIRYFARIIKGKTPGRPVGAFYGSFGCTHFLSSGICGSVLRLTEDSNLDFLAAPGVYENREPGGFVGQREMQDSFALHG